LKKLKEKPFKDTDPHYRPQWCVTMYPLVHYNKIVHLERINEEFPEVMDKLGLPGKPSDYRWDEHATKSVLRYSDYYTSECVDLVLEIYGHDFEFFGYEKAPNFTLKETLH
jgi:hypothetical protein